MVDGRDATSVLTEYARLSTNKPAKFKGELFTAADVNCDKIIDGRDASAILSFYAASSTGKSNDSDAFFAKLR